jgi:hypothetical protein
MVFHSVPQTVVHESFAVAINLSNVIADKSNISNIFICGNKSGHKKL